MKFNYVVTVNTVLRELLCVMWTSLNQYVVFFVIDFLVSSCCFCCRTFRVTMPCFSFSLRLYSLPLSPSLSPHRGASSPLLISTPHFLTSFSHTTVETRDDSS